MSAPVDHPPRPETVNGVPIETVRARLCNNCRPRFDASIGSGDEGAVMMCPACIAVVTGKPAVFMDGTVAPADHEAARAWQADQMLANMRAAGIKPEPAVPVDHPPPWRWEEIGGVFSLRDARGVRILLGDDVGGVHADDPAAKALIAAAPELEALLRYCEHILDREDEPITAGCSFEPRCDMAPPDDQNATSRPCWSCKRRTVLDAIDAARKAGS